MGWKPPSELLSFAELFVSQFMITYAVTKCNVKTSQTFECSRKYLQFCKYLEWLKMSHDPWLIHTLHIRTCEFKSCPKNFKIVTQKINWLNKCRITTINIVLDSNGFVTICCHNLWQISLLSMQQRVNLATPLLRKIADHRHCTTSAQCTSQILQFPSPDGKEVYKIKAECLWRALPGQRSAHNSLYC